MEKTSYDEMKTKLACVAESLGLPAADIDLLKEDLSCAVTPKDQFEQLRTTCKILAQCVHKEGLFEVSRLANLHFTTSSNVNSQERAVNLTAKEVQSFLLLLCPEKPRSDSDSEAEADKLAQHSEVASDIVTPGSVADVLRQSGTSQGANNEINDETSGEKPVISDDDEPFLYLGELYLGDEDDPIIDGGDAMDDALLRTAAEQIQELHQKFQNVTPEQVQQVVALGQKNLVTQADLKTSIAQQNAKIEVLTALVSTLTRAPVDENNGRRRAEESTAGDTTQGWLYYWSLVRQPLQTIGLLAVLILVGCAIWLIATSDDNDARRSPTSRESQRQEKSLSDEQSDEPTYSF